ncbi:uracil-xanthine permease family protein [Alloiococcus sp. CFN-8]|uniref:uracil-xanthine permease family protein n=1 Tax=Alloiococcus sp. CFN-8 TaxID=3416081 RepID=UPI003CF918FA
MEKNKKQDYQEGIFDARELGTPKMILLGLQHTFAMFGATVLVPMITGLDISTTLLMAGLGTLLFHLITKGKVPAFLGSSFAFLGGYAAVAPKIVENGQEVANVEMLPYACLGVASAGLIYLILAFLIKSFGVKRVMKFFPPIVTGPIIIAIGLSLAGTAVSSAQTNWPLALIALSAIIICNIWGKGMIKIVPILIGIIVSYIAAIFMNVIDFTPVLDAPWFGSPIKAEALVFGNVKDLSLAISAVLAIAPIALATIMEHIGDISAISSTTGKDFITEPGLHRTLIGDGLATTLASLFGGPANTTYGENTGVLALTKVYDPRVVRIAACFAIVFSVSPKFAALINTIPSAIVGGVSFVLYGMISAIGIRNLVENQVDFSKSRNLVIAAVIMVTALGGVTIALNETASLSSLAVASIAGIILNAIIPGEDYEIKAKEDEAPKGNTYNV